MNRKKRRVREGKGEGRMNGTTNKKKNRKAEQRALEGESVNGLLILNEDDGGLLEQCREKPRTKNTLTMDSGKGG